MDRSRELKIIDFTELPMDWEIVDFHEIVDPNRKITYGIVKPGGYDESGRLLVRAKDYSRGWVSQEEFFRVSHKVEKSYRRSRLKTGDLLLTIVGSVGNTAKVEAWLEGANITQQTARIAINESIASGDFYFHYLNSDIAKRQIYKFQKNGVQPSLNLGDISIFKILVPPLEEQRKIAEILGAWDEAIAQVEQLIAALQQRKKGLMQRLLTGQVRFPEFAGKRPWRSYDFEELFQVISGRPNQINRSDYEEVGKYPIVDQGQDYIAGYSNSEMAFTEVPVIIFGDHTRIVKWVDFPFIIGADGTKILKTKSHCTTLFGYYLLDSIHIPNLGYSRHFKELKHKILKIPVDKEEQDKISKVLQICDEEIQLLQQKHAALQQQKKGLMQRLLTGQIRVNTTHFPGNSAFPGKS